MEIKKYTVAPDAVVATKEIDDDGNETVRDSGGRILGYYKKDSDTTVDFYGRKLAKGNWTINFIKFRKQ